MSRDLHGLVVAVIGASGGLGRELCNVLTKRGCQLLVTSRNGHGLAVNDGDRRVPLSLDLRDSNAGVDLVDRAVAAFGRLDGVINAAGIVAFGNLVDTEDIVIEELFLTNVLGPLWLARRVLPALGQTKGFFASITGVVAESPLPGMVPYAASKAALSAALTGLRREARRMGVAVIDARPPHTETGLATRPLAGVAPSMPIGLSPAAVAERIVVALENDETEVPSSAF